ncbi:MAG: NAD(P)-dependent oxidoreductase, partial [Proteobacteria bacterium]|nr:NAD(P)-dependent oxidoreductase [Pseudomonadota bacterium]
MKIAFIGLGAMGGPIATRLAKAGHALTVHDLRKTEIAGTTWADAPAAAAADAAVVFTSLPGPKDVEAIAAVIGPAMKSGSAWFDLTTNSPACVRGLHGPLLKRGIQFFDAPVSGGPAGAQSGKLALWVGGDAAVYAKHEALLKVLGDQPCYVGPIGAGSVAKLAHNCASFSIQTVLAEVFTLGVKAGVDPLQLFRAMRHGAIGRKRVFDRMPDQYLPGSYDPPAFALRLAHKDLKLAMEMGRASGVPMRMSELV